MQLGIYFNQTRCTGCSACRVACKDWNDIEAGPENWMQVLNHEEGKFPDVYVCYMIRPCFHCIDPVCIPACPVNAITKREEDGIVIVDSEICTGMDECGSKCLKACPYDAPQFGAENNSKMRKCTLCIDRIKDRKKPICIDACPTRALDFGPLDELKAKYGNIYETIGYKYSERCKPAIIFKPKIKR